MTVKFDTLKSKFAAIFTLFFIVSPPLMSYSQEHNLQTGSFTIDRSATDILGEEAKAYASWMDIDENMKWEINVPEDYHPENPPGILVYVSPTNDVYAPSNWLSVTDDKNLIWVSALNSGNKKPTNLRVTLAVLSLELLQSIYQIDPNRIYITGFSGGGRIASLTATYFPDIFSGAIYICGANFWNDENPLNTEKIIQNRYVFLTGSNDFNLNDTKRVYAKYKKAGASNIKLMIIPRMGHENPKRRKLSQAIDYLDVK